MSADMLFTKPPHPFDYLNESELNLIEGSFLTVNYAQGTRILQQGGSPSENLYIIQEGAVRLVRDWQIIKVVEEGECFGYPSIITEDAPTADVVAEEESIVYQIPKEIFKKLLERNPRFAEFFLKNLGERLRRITATEFSPLDGELTAPVGALIVRLPVKVSPAASVAEVAQTMRKAWVDVALIMDNPPGIITDHDFQVKVLAEELGPGTPARQVMSQPLKSLPSDTPVHGALLFMLEQNIHHLPLTDESEIVGIVTASDLLRHQTRSPLYLMRQLRNLESSESLAKYAIEVAGMVENLCKGGLDVARIGQVIASVNDALIRRLLRLAEKKLGPPPTPYAWIVFGSEGRMEQMLITDQDNALVYEEDSPEAQQYFKDLSEQVVNDLIQAGFPPCPGGYMATNWRKPLNEWIKIFERWIRTPKPQALLETAIFFDFRSVYGDLSVEPLEKMVLESGGNGIFLAQMVRAAMEFRPPLGFFRRIRSEGGWVDLKSGGIAPIASLARIYALEAKTHVRTTVDRLETASETGTLSREGADTLIETYRFLLQLRLQEQLAAIRAGETPLNKIQLESISSLENRHLKDAFIAIREMQEAASVRFRTDLLG